MSNEKAFEAYLQEWGRVPCYIYERSACLNSKTTEIFVCGVAHKTAEIRSPIVGLMQNRIGKEEQPEATKTN